MAIPIRHTGIYRFINNAYSNYSLNAYTSSTASNGTNLCLFPSNSSDTAQRWRALYAGTKSDGKQLFFLNLIANGTDYGNNMALDRNSGATNTNNAQTYQSVYNPSSGIYGNAGKDQLVYFEDRGTNLVSIRLFSDNRALTANNPGTVTNGTSNGSITAAANVHWAAYSTTNTSQVWSVAQVSAGTSPTAVTTFPEASYFNATNNSNFPLYLGECVWYVKGRYRERRNKNFPITGNANQLWDAANGVMTRSATPIANSVACWNGGGYGHVAFVESYNSSTQEVSYSQANFDVGAILSNGQIQIVPAGADGRLQTKSRTAFEGMYGSFKGYIY